MITMPCLFTSVNHDGAGKKKEMLEFAAISHDNKDDQ
jgi:hypothetical protein